MKRTVFSKIFISYFFIVVLISSLIFTLSFRAIQDFHIDNLTKSLTNIGFALKSPVRSFIREENFKKLQSFIEDIGSEAGVRITVIDYKGVVLADSEEEPLNMENHGNRAEVKRAYAGEIGKSLRYSKTLEEDMLYVTLPLRAAEDVMVLRISYFLRDIRLFLAALKNKIIEVFFIAIFISLILAAVFSKTISYPVKELSCAYRKLADGDFSAKVFFKRKDELKELADSFNDMTEKMKALFSEISRQKEELDNVISSIQEGLVVIDKEGRVKISNDSFKKIFQDGFSKGDFYWKVFRQSPSLNEIIKASYANNMNFQEEVELKRGVFLSSGSIADKNGDIVVTFHDITDIKNLEKIKRDFAVNISHELRTPLTAIKGYAENLEEELSQDAKEYLDIIKKHTDRLINIVNDLLSLSKLEDYESLDIEKVDLKSALNNVLSMFKDKIKNKDLNLALDIDKDAEVLEADSFKLEQLFINLIDNAIKYTAEGGLAIRARAKGGNIEVDIEDTGFGIPQELLPRIFERFFVLDKSHSKDNAGTGLGLAIVKHIVLLHKGSIKVNSQLQRGTVFTVIFPKKQG